MPTRPRAFVLAFVASLTALVGTRLEAVPQDAPAEQARTLALTAGRETFRQFCAACHGTGATGNGPVARMLVAPPPDLTQLRRRFKGKFPSDVLEQTLTIERPHDTAAHGSTQMPIWGPVFQSVDSNPALVRARVANLLAYIDSIQR